MDGKWCCNKGDDKGRANTSERIPVTICPEGGASNFLCWCRLPRSGALPPAKQLFLLQKPARHIFLLLCFQIKTERTAAQRPSLTSMVRLTWKSSNTAASELTMPLTFDTRQTLFFQLCSNLETGRNLGTALPLVLKITSTSVSMASVRWDTACPPAGSTSVCVCCLSFVLSVHMIHRSHDTELTWAKLSDSSDSTLTTITPVHLQMILSSVQSWLLISDKTSSHFCFMWCEMTCACVCLCVLGVSPHMVVLSVISCWILTFSTLFRVGRSFIMSSSLPSLEPYRLPSLLPWWCALQGIFSITIAIEIYPRLLVGHCLEFSLVLQRMFKRRNIEFLNIFILLLVKNDIKNHFSSVASCKIRKKYIDNYFLQCMHFFVFAPCWGVLAVVSCRRCNKTKRGRRQKQHLGHFSSGTSSRMM